MLVGITIHMCNNIIYKFNSKKKIKKLNSRCHRVPQQSLSKVHTNGTGRLEWQRRITNISNIIGLVKRHCSFTYLTTTKCSSTPTATSSCLCSSTVSLAGSTKHKNKRRGTGTCRNTWKRSGCCSTIECCSTSRTCVVQREQFNITENHTNAMLYG